MKQSKHGLWGIMDRRNGVHAISLLIYDVFGRPLAYLLTTSLCCTTLTLQVMRMKDGDEGRLRFVSFIIVFTSITLLHLLSTPLLSSPPRSSSFCVCM